MSRKFDEIMRQMQAAIARMGGEQQTFRLDSVESETVDIRDRLSGREGLEIDINDVVVENGVFTYRGQRILLFIPDHGFRLPEKLAGTIEGNKYHLTNCRTLEQMKAQNRYARYHVTNNTEGVFKIHGTVNNMNHETETELYVCKNCLSQLNYHNYQDDISCRNTVYQQFELSDFFAEYESTISEMPPYLGQDQAGYTSNWEQISQNLRQNRHWTCEQCHVDLSGHRGLLHVHHIDGVRQHNVLSNLKVLCLLCHSEQPNHGHMRNAPNYHANITKIQQLRQN